MKVECWSNVKGVLGNFGQKTFYWEGQKLKSVCQATFARLQ